MQSWLRWPRYRHEENLRSMRSGELIALNAYRARVLTRCFTTWYTWRAVQARLRAVQSEHEERQQRIGQLVRCACLMRLTRGCWQR